MNSPGLSHRIEQARADRLAGRYTARRLLLENGLSLVLLTLFVVLWMAQSMTGWLAYNHEEQDHGQPEMRLLAYLSSGHFLEATSENWQSKFLSIVLMLVLSIFLRQTGSPESKPVESPHWSNEQALARKMAVQPATAQAAVADTTS